MRQILIAVAVIVPMAASATAAPLAPASGPAAVQVAGYDGKAHFGKKFFGKKAFGKYPFAKKHFTKKHYVKKPVKKVYQYKSYSSPLQFGLKKKKLVRKGFH